jgi:hypothetical protein
MINPSDALGTVEIPRNDLKNTYPIIIHGGVQAYTSAGCREVA